MTTTDKVEIGVNKLKTMLFALLLIALAITPAYFVDFNNIVPQDILLLFVAIFLCYCSYRYFIKRILMGPIITLTRDSMTIKDEDTARIYRWTIVKKVKVEIVTEKDIEGKSVSHTLLNVWTTTNNKSDEFHVSDLEMNSDEIRDLINNYTERYSR